MRATWYIWLPLPPASRLVNLLPLPLPLSYNLTEIAGLITRGLLTIWFLKILPGLTLEPNSSPLKNHGMVFEIRDDPSAFCWSSAYSQARNVSLVWDSLSEFFFWWKSWMLNALAFRQRLSLHFDSALASAIPQEWCMVVSHDQTWNPRLFRWC